MTSLRISKNDIEEIALDILSSSKQLTIPINLDEISKLLELDVIYFPFPDEISGLLKKEVGVIGINENQHSNRQRFTLAHEIGHYILGHKIISNEDMVDDTLTDTSQTPEREANYFASAILMPRIKLKEEYKKTPSVKELSKLFEVSEQAMTIRVLELGLIR